MKYLLLTLKHKWFVLLAGIKTGAPMWQLIIHDLSKLTRAELPHYQRQFFGSADDPEGFARCWLHHQNHNPHHWEYWIQRTGHDRDEHGGIQTERILRMPGWAVREMIADWLGAGRAYEGKWPDINNWVWFDTRYPQMRLHPSTQKGIMRVLIEIGYKEPDSDE